MKASLIILLIFGLIEVGLSSNTNCYVLAMEGGGDAGSYEAGVVYGLVNNLPAD